MAGATGVVGRLTVQALRITGNDPIPMARGTGVDLVHGTGLEVLVGADAVIDVTNCSATESARTEDFFAAVTTNLLSAEHDAGVGHHVVLSIVNVDQLRGLAHYAGKRVQEALVDQGPVPWTIQRATQFFEFAEMVVDRGRGDGRVVVPPLLMQPVAAADVAGVLVEATIGSPLGRAVDLAGPDQLNLVDMARRLLAARGQDTEVVAGWRGPLFGPELARNHLLPGTEARLTTMDFAAWLHERTGQGADE